MAQSLWHHNFATIRHRVVSFSAKCSERNSLHDWSQCLNTAVNFFCFCRWQVNYKKQYYPRHCGLQKLPLLFFEQLRETLADFNNFWHVTLKKLDAIVYSFGHLTLMLLLHYLVKGRVIIAVDNNEFILGSACIGSENYWNHKINENLLLCLCLNICRV